ncbi:MAG: hypothetical protein QOE90_2533 [Thermoplasmata archaeon]|jgi:hypothetical protein|nr:hypothetical protein [Thermoplasmata archaeon]
MRGLGLLVVASLLITPFAAAVALPVQDDAGSGRDASAQAPVPVLAGVSYRGAVEHAFFPDGEDTFSFDAAAGQTLYLGVLSADNTCWTLLEPSGAAADLQCLNAQGELSDPTPILAESGTHLLRVVTPDVATYAFTFTLSRDARIHVPTPVPSDDAGSGADAPNVWPDALPIHAGIAYPGDLDGGLFDNADLYSFDVAVGQAIHAAARGVAGCYQLVRPDGSVADETCPVGETIGAIDATADVGGAWSVVYRLAAGGLVREPQRYAFGVGLDAPAPDLGALTG